MNSNRITPKWVKKKKERKRSFTNADTTSMESKWTLTIKFKLQMASFIFVSMAKDRDFVERGVEWVDVG